MKTRIELLMSSKLGNEDDLIELIGTFLPFAKRTIHTFNMTNDFEDALSHITLFLLCLFKRLDSNIFTTQEDKYLVGYVQLSIKRELIRLSKKHTDMPVPISQLDYKIDSDKFTTAEDIYDIGQADILKQLLTAKQFQIIFQYFYSQLSISEIAVSLQTSQNSVRKHLRIALEILRNHPKIEELL